MAGKIQGLLFNDDTDSFFHRYGPDDMTGEQVDAEIDLLADAGVSGYFCGLNAQRTKCYQSQVWQSMWEGFDPDGPDNQPRLRACLPEEVAAYRKWFNNCLLLHQRGVDYPARAIERCRKHGLTAWLNVRMNDAHGLEGESNPMPSDFVRDNPTLCRVPYQKHFRADRALDYAHAQVREHYRVLIEELLDRYDLDGLELDFTRHHLYFAIGRELEGAPGLTEWVGGIRKMVEEAAKRRGRPIMLGVRVTSRPETARNIGTDVMEWVRRGWLDLVTVASSVFAATTDFNMPTRLWRELLDPYDVALAGGIEPAAQSCGPMSMVGSSTVWLDPALALGNAAAVLAGGADAVYLFNFFPQLLQKNGGWKPQDLQETFKAMGSLPALEAWPRRHVVTYREVVAPGELIAYPEIILTGELTFPDSPLPARGKYGIFRLQTGPKPADRKVQVVLGFVEAKRSAINIRVNGIPCDLAAGAEDEDRLRFDVPAEAFTDEAHVIEVYANLGGGKPFVLTWVEMDIAAAGGQ